MKHKMFNTAAKKTTNFFSFKTFAMTKGITNCISVLNNSLSLALSYINSRLGRYEGVLL